MSPYQFIRSKKSPRAEVRPVFFYHLPKCGGMTVHSVAVEAWRCVINYAESNLEIVVGRLDAPEEICRNQQPYAYLSSHLPFGIHRQLPGDPYLLTVVREPVARVLSQYTYSRMRSGLPVSADECRAFFCREENTNVMVKSLAGKAAEQPLIDGDLHRARHNLDRHFSFVGTTDDITEICEAYLRLCGLPNVLSQRINRTAPGYQLATDDFAEEIRALNAADAELFDDVQARGPVIHADAGAAGGGVETLHPLTVIIADLGDDRKSAPHACLAYTDRLLAQGTLGPDGSTDGPTLDYLVKKTYGLA